MPNLPMFFWELSGEEKDDGFGNIMESAREIVVDGYQPCDGCGRIHYTEETACEFPDKWRNDTPAYQHCQCWYECAPCCKCGEDASVLYGPPAPEHYAKEIIELIRQITNN